MVVPLFILFIIDPSPEDDHISQHSGLGQILCCPFQLSIDKLLVSEKEKTLANYTKSFYLEIAIK